MKKFPVHEYETEGWIPSRYALQDDFNDFVSEKTPGINQAFARERAPILNLSFRF